MKCYHYFIVCVLLCVDLVLSGHIPVCRQPKVVGNCKAMIPRYYYNFKDDECELFYYGGCGGNKNNFETLEECEDTCGCDDIQDDFDCDMDPEVGPCKAALTRYYYDEDDGKCKKFIYGGCLGNKNNFKTKSDCYDKCGDIQNDFDCDMDPEVGPCKAALTRYYYDEDDGMCRKFIYGGCKGNKNNFKTKFDCYDKCGDIQNYFDCDLEPDSGPCYGYFPRYYYDKNDDTCKKFIYGGCKGNKNRFQTVSDCYRRCGDRQTNFDCDKGPVVGPCDGYFPRYYYDEYDDMCKMFIYGGCLGNKNNFMTVSECYNRCRASQTNFDCNKGPVVGPCRGHFPRYYYDKKDDTCKKFIYGGCLGNKNNFMTVFDCYNSCGEW